MIRNEGNETDLLRFDILTHMYVIKLLLYFDTHILPLTEIEKKKNTFKHIVYLISLIKWAFSSALKLMDLQKKQKKKKNNKKTLKPVRRNSLLKGTEIKVRFSE